MIFLYGCRGFASCLGRLDLTRGLASSPCFLMLSLLVMCAIFSVSRTFVWPEVRTDLGGFSPVGDHHALAPVPTDQKSWGLTGTSLPQESPVLGGEAGVQEEDGTVRCSRSLTPWGGCGEEKVSPRPPSLVCPAHELQLGPVSGPS